MCITQNPVTFLTSSSLCLSLKIEDVYFHCCLIYTQNNRNLVILCLIFTLAAGSSHDCVAITVVSWTANREQRSTGKWSQKQLEASLLSLVASVRLDIIHTSTKAQQLSDFTHSCHNIARSFPSLPLNQTCKKMYHVNSLHSGFWVTISLLKHTRWFSRSSENVFLDDKQ